MNTTEEWITNLMEPRQHRGAKWFPTARLAKVGELTMAETLYVKALRRRGLRAEVFIEPTTGHRVGICAHKRVSCEAMLDMAKNEMASMEFDPRVDFDMFRTIALEEQADRLEKFFDELDRAEGVV